MSFAKAVGGSLALAALNVVAAPYVLASSLATILDEVVISGQTASIVKNEYAFELVSVDGEPVKRDETHYLTDAQPNAVVRGGDHIFSARVRKVRHRQDEKWATIEFRATVKGGSTYMVSGSPDKPELIEVSSK